MSLTISQPPRTEFGHRYTHEFNSRISIAKSRFSPKPRVDSPSPVSSLRVSATPSDVHNMSTSHPHRGLPPPSAMALPDPRREGPPPSLTQPLVGLGSMPAAPAQWSGQEDSMRNWLAAKAEEDKRKQEEERTQQETLRLEQRKIEQSMLRESLQGGVPPHMVPFIYAGIGGSLANISMDWLQQYAGQLQVSQQQIQQTSPDIRRDQGRLIGPPPAYPVAQPTHQPVLPSQHGEPLQPPPGAMQTTFSAYQPASARPQSSAPRSATHTQLPRLTTNEMYVHQPPQGGAGSAHPLQQSQTIQQQDHPSSSPSIYFHHWVPPSESKGRDNPPQTPASKGDPQSAHPGSSVHESEYRDSPRKRKAQGGHQANPPPSAGPQYTSPSFSTTSSVASGRKGGHARSRSNASLGRDSDSRPDSRREDQAPPLQPPPPPRSSHPDSGNTNVSEGPTRPPSRPEEPSGRSSADMPREREVFRTEAQRPGSR